jgi:large subunit ribosomal protein L10
LRRQEKAEIIDSLEETFSRCQIGILTEYRGVTTTDINNLRRKLREVKIEYRVVKNTLARFAAERLGWSEVAPHFAGPLAIACGYGDVSEAAKTLTDYIISTKSVLVVRGAFMANRMLTPKEVTALSTMPKRDVLIAQVLGGMQSPIANLVGTLSGPLAGLARVLQGRMKQLEGN